MREACAIEVRRGAEVAEDRGENAERGRTPDQEDAEGSAYAAQRSLTRRVPTELRATNSGSWRASIWAGGTVNSPTVVARMA